MKIGTNTTAVQPQIKESDQLKALIAENRTKIAAYRVEIAKLANKRAGTIESLQIQNQIVSRRQGIKSLEMSTERLQDRLAQIVPLEAVLSKIQAQTARQQADREQAAELAHLDAIRAALAEWLRMPGQTEQGFNAAWPAMAARIATEAATDVAAELHADTQQTPNTTAAIVTDLLAAKYGLPGAKGHQAGGTVQRVFSR